MTTKIKPYIHMTDAERRAHRIAQNRIAEEKATLVVAQRTRIEDAKVEVLAGLIRTMGMERFVDVMILGKR